MKDERKAHVSPESHTRLRREDSSVARPLLLWSFAVVVEMAWHNPTWVQLQSGQDICDVVHQRHQTGLL
jgi:hypothetical protein